MNVGLSVSRVGSAAQIKAMKQVAGSVKLELAQYREMAAFSQFASGLDPATQKLLKRGERLSELLKQPQYSPLSVEEQVIVTFTGVKGYLDELEVNQVSDFIDQLIQHIHKKKSKIIKAIQKEQKITESIETDLRETIKGFLSLFVG